MTEEGFKYLERELNLKLPRAYLDIMGSAEAQAAGFWYRGLYNYCMEVFHQTLGLREVGTSDNVPLSNAMLAISQVNAADLLLLDTEDENGRIYLLNHESLELETFDTLQHFTDAC